MTITGTAARHYASVTGAKLQHHPLYPELVWVGEAVIDDYRQCAIEILDAALDMAARNSGLSQTLVIEAITMMYADEVPVLTPTPWHKDVDRLQVRAAAVFAQLNDLLQPAERVECYGRYTAPVARQIFCRVADASPRGCYSATQQLRDLYIAAH